MTVDNLGLILPLLEFNSPDEFYYIQILQRKKENPQLGSNSRVIKNYYINSEEHLLNRYDEIKKLCELFNARASIRLNKRSYEKVAYKTMINIANTMGNREFSFIKKSYDRAVGQGHSYKDKTWILDADKGDADYNLISMEGFVEGYLEDTQPLGDKVLAMIPSKSGMHVITRPFDLRQFREQFPDIEVHKDNPTNLYIP